MDRIIKDLDLGSANEVITPGEKDPKGKAVDNEEEVGPSEATQYRAIVARANYLASVVRGNRWYWLIVRCILVVAASSPRWLRYVWDSSLTR